MSLDCFVGICSRRRAEPFCRRGSADEGQAVESQVWQTTWVASALLACRPRHGSAAGSRAALIGSMALDAPEGRSGYQQVIEKAVHVYTHLTASADRGQRVSATLGRRRPEVAVRRLRSRRVRGIVEQYARARRPRRRHPLADRRRNRQARRRVRRRHRRHARRASRSLRPRAQVGRERIRQRPTACEFPGRGCGRPARVPAATLRNCVKQTDSIAVSVGGLTSDEHELRRLRRENRRLTRSARSSRRIRLEGPRAVGGDPGSMPRAQPATDGAAGTRRTTPARHAHRSQARRAVDAGGQTERSARAPVRQDDDPGARRAPLTGVTYGLTSKGIFCPAA